MEGFGGRGGGIWRWRDASLGGAGKITPITPHCASPGREGEVEGFGGRGGGIWRWRDASLGGATKLRQSLHKSGGIGGIFLTPPLEQNCSNHIAPGLRQPKSGGIGRIFLTPPLEQNCSNQWGRSKDGTPCAGVPSVGFTLCCWCQPCDVLTNLSGKNGRRPESKIHREV